MSQAAARAERPEELCACDLGPLDIANAERDGRRLHRAARDRQVHRITANQLNPFSKRRVPNLDETVGQHRPGKVDADDARGAAARLSDRDVRGTGADKEHVLASGQLQGGNRLSTPVAIEAAG